MLNLIFAPSADLLVRPAAKRIRAAWTDPFDPPAVIAPNPAVGKWLSTRLIKEPGLSCVANARILTLEKFLWKALDGGNATMLNAGHLSQVICALLDETLIDEKIYKPLSDYLRGNGEKIDALKRVQLSVRIAGQFLEYEYNRPSVWDDNAGWWKRDGYGLDAKWIDGKKYYDDDLHELWQRDLYKRTYDLIPSDELITLPHLYRKRREECAKVKRPWCEVGTNKQVFLFGVSKISHFHRNTLVEISQMKGVDMHVFLTNPCAEFWEDVDTSRRSVTPRRVWKNSSSVDEAGIRPVKPEDYNKEELDLFNYEEDHALLKLWGSAGKENIYLWCPMADWDFEYRCESQNQNQNQNQSQSQSQGQSQIMGGKSPPEREPAVAVSRYPLCGVAAPQWGAVDPQRPAIVLPPSPLGEGGTSTSTSTSKATLLKAIQQSLLLRENDLDISEIDIENDQSIQILACPDIGREVEELREQILDMADDEAIDTFGDIAVYIPDTSKYMPHIQRVFGAYPFGHPLHIPFTILGATGGASMTARGIKALLAIIGGEFNRARIFELFRNPVVQKSKDITARDVDRWTKWAKDYGMYRGYDKEQRRRMGDMGDTATDEHTFMRGIEIIRRGELCSPDTDIPTVNDTANDTAQPGIINDNETSAALISFKKFRDLLGELNDLSSYFSPQVIGCPNERANAVRPYDDDERSSLNINNDHIDVKGSVEHIRRAIWSWFGRIPDDGAVNGRAESNIRAEALSGLDDILLQSSIAKRGAMPLDEFFAHLRGCVPEETDVTSNAWNGVTFAPLRASMALPHRAIFVLGLGASEFPGTNEKGDWDLLSGKHKDNITGKPRRNRIIGDSDRVRDNRFAFLELIHAAKERLVLSYRAHDMQKDEPFEPSSVVLELEEWLTEQGVKKGERECSIRREIPWVIHESIEVAIKHGRKHGTWDKTQHKLATSDTEERVRHRHDIVKSKSFYGDGGYPPVTPPPKTDNPKTHILKPGYGGLVEIIDRKKSTAITSDTHSEYNGHKCHLNVDIRNIKIFLKNPLEYHLSEVLKIRDDDEADMSGADEPVESPFKLSLQKRAIWFAILELIFSPDAKSTDVKSLFEQASNAARRIYDEHADTGLAPEGHAKRMEKEGLVRWAKMCAYDALALRQYFPAHRFSKRGALNDDNEGGFSIDCGEFTLIGNLAPAVVPIDPNDKTQGIGIVSFLKKGAPKCVRGGKNGDNYELWLDAAARRLCDIDNGGERPLSAVLLDYHEDAKTRATRKSLYLGNEDEIKKYLKTIAAQMLAERRSEHLPFESMAKLVDTNSLDADMIDDEKKKLGETNYEDHLEKLTVEEVNKAMQGYGSFTEGFDLTDLDSMPVTLSDGGLREIVGVRYAPMLKRWIYD